MAIPEDMPLRQITMFLHAMRACDLTDARLLHKQMDRYFDQCFIQPSISATSRHRNLLVQWSRPILANFAALALFDCCNEEPGTPGPDTKVP